MIGPEFWIDLSNSEIMMLMNNFYLFNSPIIFIGNCDLKCNYLSYSFSFHSMIIRPITVCVYLHTYYFIQGLLPYCTVHYLV